MSFLFKRAVLVSAIFICHIQVVISDRPGFTSHDSVVKLHVGGQSSVQSTSDGECDCSAFQKISQGTCSAAGLFDIDEREECKHAAQSLELVPPGTRDKTFETSEECEANGAQRPHGCVFTDFNRPHMTNHIQMNHCDTETPTCGAVIGDPTPLQRDCICRPKCRIIGGKCWKDSEWQQKIEELCVNSFRQLNWEAGREVRTRYEMACSIHEYFEQMKQDNNWVEGFVHWTSEAAGGAEDLSVLKEALADVEDYIDGANGIDARCVHPLKEGKLQELRTPQECGVLLKSCMRSIERADKPVSKVYRRMMNYKDRLEGGAGSIVTGLEITKTTSFVAAGTIATVVTGGAATSALGSMGMTSGAGLHVISYGIGGGAGSLLVTFSNMTATQFGEKMAGLKDEMDWKAIRDACIKQSITGVVAGGIAAPLANFASPFVGQQVIRLLRHVPGIRGASGLATHLPRFAGILRTMLEDATEGAIWNGITTCVVEAWTYATDPTSRSCYDACATIPVTSPPSKFSQKCALVGRQHNGNGTLDGPSSDAACMVSEDACEQKTEVSCGSLDEAECTARPQCSVGSQKTFVCKLAFEMIKGAVGGIIFRNNGTLGALDTRFTVNNNGGFKSIGRDHVKDVEGLLGFLSTEAAFNSIKEAAATQCR